MNETLAAFSFFGHSLVITGWKILGYGASLLFAGRWVVQFVASRRHGRPTMPGLFWYMSIVGSLFLLAYFIWGKNDSVGILSNLFPTGVALYNLYLHETHKRKPHPADPAETTK